jgi:UDP-GlcNAc3NAcA epimerase|tara:strand:+ start:353 stop:553 length:201 start_codon:yes stop_codon:yes gene_type:complete
LEKWIKRVTGLSKITSIIGARLQFNKATMVSMGIENQKGIDEFIIHTGQHFDNNLTQIFFYNEIVC